MENNCQHPTQETRMTGWVWLNANIITCQVTKLSTASVIRIATQNKRFASFLHLFPQRTFVLVLAQLAVLFCQPQQCNVSPKDLVSNTHNQTYTLIHIQIHTKRKFTVLYTTSYCEWNSLILNVYLIISLEWLSVVILRDVWWNCGVSRVNR